MSINRSTWWLLALGFLSVLASQADAQRFQPFGPLDFDMDLQLFAPAEVEEYGGEPQPNTGYFVSWERVYWTIGAPRRMPIGNTAGDPPPTSSADASAPNTPFSWTNRYELGYMTDENHGWLLTIVSNLEQNQGQFYGFIPDPDNPPAAIGPGAFVGFSDPLLTLMGFQDRNGDGFDDDLNANRIFGRDGEDTPDDQGAFDGVPDTPAPTDFLDMVAFASAFETLTARNTTNLKSVALMKQHRLRPFHHGSIIEWFYGARFLRFHDQFGVTATGGMLADSDWQTTADNNIIGPQIGGRWYSKRGRWTISGEGRFLAGLNIQNFRQSGLIGSLMIPDGQNAPVDLGPVSFRHTGRTEEFSPVAELRVDTTYQITREMSLKVGWTGLYVGGIARGSNLTDYTLPSMGLLATNLENVFVHGVNFGIEVNR